MLSKVFSLQDILEHIHDGQTIMFGDWHGQFAADEIIDGMLEKGVKDIKAIAVSAGYPGQGVGKLIVAHRVSSIITTHIGLNPEALKQMLAGELAVAEHCPRHLILRTAWVFGEHGNNFVKTMLRLGAQRDSLGIVADQFGGPTYAGDIAAALLTMARQALQPDFNAWGIYHFAGEPHVSWHGFATSIFDAAVAQGLLARSPLVNAIATRDYPTPAQRPANSRLDCGKIRQVFAIEPSNWQAALQNIKAYA